MTTEAIGHEHEISESSKATIRRLAVEFADLIAVSQSLPQPLRKAVEFLKKEASEIE